MTKQERYQMVNFYTRQVMNVEKALLAEHNRMKAIGSKRARHPPGSYWAVYCGLSPIEDALWYGGVLPGFISDAEAFAKFAGTYKIDALPDVEPEYFVGIFPLLKEEPFWRLLSQSYRIDKNGKSKPAARLVAYIMGFSWNGSMGIGSFDTVSKLWKALALAVGEDGRAQHPVSNKTHSGNYVQKSNVLERIGAMQLILQNSPYRPFYNKEKAKYLRKAENGTVGPSNCWHLEHAHKSNGKTVMCVDSGHPHRSALRVTAKEWLKHFWQRWRECEGLAVIPPYARDHWTDPYAYGWPEVSEFV